MNHGLICPFAVLFVLGCASDKPQPPQEHHFNYEWADTMTSQVIPKFPYLADDHAATLNEALEVNRLVQMQAHIEAEGRGMFQTGGGGCIKIGPNRCVYYQVAQIAILPLVRRGTAAVPELLHGLKSDKEYVRWSAGQALEAIYRIDVEYYYYMPPDAPEAQNQYRIWEAIVRANSVAATQRAITRE